MKTSDSGFFINIFPDKEIQMFFYKNCNSLHLLGKFHQLLITNEEIMKKLISFLENNTNKKKALIFNFKDLKKCPHNELKNFFTKLLTKYDITRHKKCKIEGLSQKKLTNFLKEKGFIIEH